jgi:hypothetical protein
MVEGEGPRLPTFSMLGVSETAPAWALIVRSVARVRCWRLIARATQLYQKGDREGF